VHYRKALRQALLLLTPVIALLVAAAPLVLAPFGGWYAAQGATALRLVALSALPATVQTLQMYRARVTRDMRIVAVTLIVLCVLVLAVTMLLVPRVGLAGAGVAWVVGQSVVTVGVAVWHRHRPGGPRHGPAPGRGAHVRHAARVDRGALRPPGGRHRSNPGPAAHRLAPRTGVHTTPIFGVAGGFGQVWIRRFLPATLTAVRLKFHTFGAVAAPLASPVARNGDFAPARHRTGPNHG
jgi:hypothetical protein